MQVFGGLFCISLDFHYLCRMNLIQDKKRIEYMNRLLSICLLMLLGATSLWACPAFPKPADVKQPDGTVFTLCLHGDEFLSFSTTIDGYTVVKGADGFYRYAEKNADGQLKATDVIARNPEARTVAEVSFLSARKKMVAPKMSESSRQMKEMAAQMYIENATVQHIDIVWDEEDQAYLPLISMSQPMNDFDDDMEDDDFMDDDIEETPHHKNHPHGKKKNLFN